MPKQFSVKNYFQEHSEVFSKLDFAEIEQGIKLIKDTFDKGGKIFTCGNGGSALTASHYITDWTKMVNIATNKKFLGFSLVDNIGLVTAYGNDLSYDDIFKGQLLSLMNENDLLIAISGSGNSRNVLNAVDVAKTLGGKTLGIIGYDGGRLLKKCDFYFLVKSFDMQICEDIHLMFGHMVMKALCSEGIT